MIVRAGARVAVTLSWLCLAGIAGVAGAASATSAATAPEPAARAYTRNVAIVVYEGVEALDFAGPLEVFDAAANSGASGGHPAFNVYTVSRSKAPLTSQGVLTVKPQYSIDDAPKSDIIVIPGGQSSSITQDAAFMKWVVDGARASELTMTVCTGAMALGKAGLLDGLDVTTWFGATDRLQQIAPKARVQRGRRFIDNGHYITTAGVSAGIDGALHVVARLLGRQVAEQTAQYMEYRWTPEPYLVSGYSLLNPSLDENGRAVQLADLAAASGDLAGAIAGYRRVLADVPNDHTVWFSLGNALIGSKQYESGITALLKAAASPDLAAGAYYNAARGSSLAANGARAIELLGKAIDAGLKGRQALADPDLETARKDPRWAGVAARLQ